MIKLTITNLSKKYISSIGIFRKSTIEKIAINKLSTEFSPGYYGLLGPNGAGKTTLMNLITNVIEPNEGEILFNDVPINILGDKYRQIIGYMPQHQKLYENFTGKHFLFYMCALKGISKDRINEESLSVAQKVNLSNELEKKIREYSGGMKQRLLLAATLIGNPLIILLDEPTAGLDPKERANFRKLIKFYSKKSIVIVSTHVVSDVEDIADEIIILKNGTLFAKGAPVTLIDHYAPNKKLEDVYMNIFGEGDYL